MRQALHGEIEPQRGGSSRRGRPLSLELSPSRQKRVHGFATGDLVIASVPVGKNVGIHIGRVAVRATGSFNVQAKAGLVHGISSHYYRLLQRGDGYGYPQGQPIVTDLSAGSLSLPRLKAGVSRGED